MHYSQSFHLEIVDQFCQQGERSCSSNQTGVVLSEPDILIVTNQLRSSDVALKLSSGPSKTINISKIGGLGGDTFGPKWACTNTKRKIEEDEDNSLALAKKPRVLDVSPNPNLPPKDVQSSLTHSVLKRQKKKILGSSLKAQARLAALREKASQGVACNPEDSEVSHVSDS
ncbi:hypothetical protein FCV25MIE_14004, partial [Fagus crenata]